MRQALILAGGKGTRLISRLNGAPKPLVPIDGRPLLDHQIDALARHGIQEVIILANYRADAIHDHCIRLQRPGMQIRVAQDLRGERGTAGAVYDLADQLQETFLVLYGDTLLDVDLSRLWQAHQNASQAYGALGTLFLHPNNHPHDSDLVEIDDDGRVVAFHAKPHADGNFYPNLVNAALYVLDRKLLEAVPAGEGLVDFGKDIFPRAVQQGVSLNGYVTFEYIKDVGTPDRLDRAEADLRSGKVARSRLHVPQKAVFLDRDGTLNKPAGHIATPDALDLIAGAGAAVRQLNRAEFRCVLVTNQPVLARGDCDATGLDRIHAKLETMLGREGGFLDAIYVCPHHPDSGFAGEVPALKIHCDCRKPAPGLLIKAQADLGIAPQLSWMVGDTAADVGAARQAGIRSILVRTGGHIATSLGVEPDFEVDTIGDAAHFITSGHDRMREALSSVAAEIAPGTLIRIAGQSRQGKSLLAGVLRDMLHERGLPAAQIRMDRWLRPPAERMPDATPYEAFNWERLAAQLAPWTAGNALQMTLPGYDPAEKPLPEGPHIRLPEDGVMILDGTLSFDFGQNTKRKTINIFVDGPEDIRRHRFNREYARRGCSPEAIDQLYHQRMGYEFPMLTALKDRADLVLLPDHAYAGY